MKDENAIVRTNDGSSTLKNETTGDLYHSIHGAETESNYVFIEKGFIFKKQEHNSLSILEVGLGTGLNALLTFKSALESEFGSLKYTSLEPFPIDNNLINQLKYRLLEQEENNRMFKKIHNDVWNEEYLVSGNIKFTKIKSELQNFDSDERFDLLYYDAFGPTYQPGMWKKEVLQRAVNLLKTQGVFVTYCAQGKFRRTLISLGLQVERLEGPPGKREMIRAIKR